MGQERKGREEFTRGKVGGASRWDESWTAVG